MAHPVNSRFVKTDEYIFRNDPGFFLKASAMEPQNVTDPHCHEFTECIFITQGEGKHQCGKRPERRVSRGDILIIPPGGVHSYTEAPEDFFLINFIFDTSQLPPALLELYSSNAYKDLFLRNLSYYEKSDYPIFHPPEELFEELELFARKLIHFCKTPGNHCLKMGIFMVLLSLLTNAREKSEPVNSGASVLDIPKLTAFLQENFKRPIYLSELTRHAAMSPATLLRHFRASLGMTPMEYLLKLRLNYAAELLLNSDLPIKEAADAAGFSTAAYFFRVFKKHFGVTPSDFRHSGGRRR